MKFVCEIGTSLNILYGSVDGIQDLFDNVQECVFNVRTQPENVHEHETVNTLKTARDKKKRYFDYKTYFSTFKTGAIIGSIIQDIV